MNKGKPSETLVVIMLALIVVFWLTKNPTLLIISFAVGLTGLLIPQAMQGLHWLWMKLSLVLSFISGRILLTVIFVVVLVPLSFLSKIFGKRIIHFKRSGLTYFKERNHIFIKEDLENLW